MVEGSLGTGIVGRSDWARYATHGSKPCMRNAQQGDIDHHQAQHTGSEMKGEIDRNHASEANITKAAPCEEDAVGWTVKSSKPTSRRRHHAEKIPSCGWKCLQCADGRNAVETAAEGVSKGPAMDNIFMRMTQSGSGSIVSWTVTEAARALWMVALAPGGLDYSQRPPRVLQRRPQCS